MLGDCKDRPWLRFHDSDSDGVISCYIWRYISSEKRLRAIRTRRGAAERWLNFVGMGSFAAVPGAGLSYGESKLHLASPRVLATEADVLLLDEPASGIDIEWIDRMLDLVLAVNASRAARCASSSTTCTSSAAWPTRSTSWRPGASPRRAPSRS